MILDRRHHFGLNDPFLRHCHQKTHIFRTMSPKDPLFLKCVTCHQKTASLEMLEALVRHSQI